MCTVTTLSKHYDNAATMLSQHCHSAWDKGKRNSYYGVRLSESREFGCHRVRGTKSQSVRESESQRVRRVKKGSKEAQKSQNKKEKETIFMKSES